MKFGIRELFFVLLLMAIPGGAYFWVFRPANEHIEKQRVDIDVKEAKLVNLQKAMVGVRNLGEEVDRLKEAVSFFESKLPPRHEIHKVLKQVTEIADQHGLETKLFETLRAKPYADYSEQPIQLELAGSFDAFYQFLLEVEKMPRITKIKDMQLERDKKDTGLMLATLKMSIFFDNNAQGARR